MKNELKQKDEHEYYFKVNVAVGEVAVVYDKKLNALWNR